VIDHADPDRLRALAAWVDAFERPGFAIGEWAGGERDAAGVIQMPYVDFAPEGLRFIGEMYAHTWVYPFDWMAWASTPEAQVLIADPTQIAHAPAEDLARLLTTIIRGDRFSEGEIAGAYERGTLTAIARRARVLLGETGKHGGPGR
jgi:hypothetical protein